MEGTASQIFYLGPSFYFMHIKLFITIPFHLMYKTAQKTLYQQLSIFKYI